MNEASPRNFWPCGRAHVGQTLGASILVAFIFACATTRQETPILTEDHCVYLSPEICPMLAAGTDDQFGLRYVAPNVQWSQYTQVMISPVTVWGNAKQELSASNSQALANYLYGALVQQIGTKFQVVDEPGPGVMKLQVALTSAEGATPVLRSISMIVPQVRLLNFLQSQVTGTYAFLGGAQMEAYVSDAVTGQSLAAAVDRRVGGRAVRTAAQWRWGDAKNVMDAWAAMTVDRLAKLQSGAIKS